MAFQELWSETLPLAQIETIHAELRAKYGDHSLSATPEDILKKVLRRGSLKTENEAYVIRNLVSNVEKENELGKETYRRLCELIERFEADSA